MKETNNLNRFLVAQESNYINAFQEIKSGKKTGHWMWYIFPQIDGLGFSSTTKFYSIKSIEEAKQYLNHPILGSRLIEISKALLNLKIANPIAIFGYTDSLKLKCLVHQSKN